MKTLLNITLILLLFPAVSLAGNGHWGSMIWDQNNWYSPTGDVSGTINTSFAGHNNLSVANAQITVEGTNYITTTDSNGAFTFSGIPEGTYNLVVSAQYLETLTHQIVVWGGQIFQIDDLPSMTIEASQYVWDVDGDNKIGLSDIIYGLQILSGTRPDD